MEALYAIQQDLFKQAATAFANFKKKGRDKMTVVAAQARLTGLESCGAQFEANHRNILSSKDVPRDHEYFKSDYSEQFLDTYYDRKGEFLQFIEDAKRAIQAQNPHVNVGHNEANVTINAASLEAQALPKMSLPKFSGKFAEWENFRDLFRSIVHRRADLDPSIKYYHLRSNLTGDALDHIKAIPIAGDQYETAWATLTNYYDNKRRTVNTLVSSILAIKPMKTESDSELKRIFREFFSPLESLRTIGRTEQEITNDILVHLAVELFESNTKREWKKPIDKTNDNPPSLENLKEFISGEIENLDEGRDKQSNSSRGKGPKVKQSQTNAEATTVQSLQTVTKDSNKNPPPKAISCALCGADHYLSKCDQFTGKSISERREFVKNKHMCFNCLGSGHSQNRCKSRFCCFTCRKKHHTLLHNDQSESEYDSGNAQTQANQSSVSANCASAVDTIVNSAHTTRTAKEVGVLLATALVAVIGPSNKRLLVRALIDPCSQVSIITESLADLLMLKEENANVCVQGVGEQRAIHASKLVQLQLKPHFESSYCLKATALVLPAISAYKPPGMRWAKQLNFLEGLQLADPSYLEDTQVQVLLGADVYVSIIENDMVRGSEQQLIAIKSKLGWLLTGKVSEIEAAPQLPSASHHIANVHCAAVTNQDTHLSDLLREFWRVEEVPECKNSLPEEDERCEKLYMDTTYRDRTGRYVVKLPWKDPKRMDDIRLGSSYPRALAALKSLESRFQKDKRLQAEYTKFIKEYIELGHMTPIDEVPSSNADYFFLPHHAVWKEASSTTKLRIVFNGSSKLSSGESLNDLLYSGRNLLRNPVDLICLIRNYRVALSADVEKMFRMVRVDPRDRRFQAILWRFSALGKIVIYVLNTLTYGLTCSAYLAIRTLLQMATDFEKEYPVAAQVVREEMYSDNVLTGAHSTNEARDKVAELISLFAKAQMNLRKWASNDPQVLSALPEKMLTEDRVTLFNANTATPLLGIAWYTSSKGDYFGFLCDFEEIAKPITKRKVLSRIARLFDPLGWIAPIIVCAKIFMQSLWLRKIGWDEPLPEDLEQNWLGWVWTSLQVAKSKVAPVKTLSIPRLELCAALLLTRLAKQFIGSTKLEIRHVHLWSDSADVLFWLKDHPSRWNVFVANRCSEIHTSLPHAYWHHVRTNENPADLVSRGVEPSKLSDNGLWWNGPEFLREKPGTWSMAQDDLNFAVTNVVMSNTCRIPSKAEHDLPKVWTLINHYSSLDKLLRITVYILRFVGKINNRIKLKGSQQFKGLKSAFVQKNVVCHSGAIQASERQNVQTLWCYLVQRAYFDSEYQILAANRSLSAKSPMACLNPCMKDHLIRVGGRLRNSLSLTPAKHPIILPHSCPLTTLFIRQAHLRCLHGGTQLTLATLRQQVWIIRGRTEVRKVVRGCVQCTRYARQVPSQLMGDLPAARVRPAYPFQRSGVDYAGPLYVRLTKSRGKGTLKGYICVFVCMATRAVHLELAEDYTTESFIAAFHRFTARRGHCAELFSDQGTNFIGADTELKAMLENSWRMQKEAADVLSKEGTIWHFNPPSAPHFGGLWEAAVKSLKHHLRRVIGSQVLTFSELATLLCRVEACLNSRPLMGITDDPSDLEFLTPAHFLIQRASYLVPEHDLTSANVPMGKWWQLLSQMTQHFWSRWKNEYLASLQSRNKWLQAKPTAKLGDMVLVRNENTPPAKWPLGRVVALHPGEDGIIRVVTVKLATGHLRRPIVKLVFLPIQSSSDSFAGAPAKVGGMSRN